MLACLVTACLAAVVLAAAPAQAQPLNVSADRTVSPTPAAPGDVVTVTTNVTLNETVSGTLNETVQADGIELAVVDDGGATAVTVDDGAGTIEATYDNVTAVTLVYEVILPEGDSDVAIDGAWIDNETHPLGTDQIEVTTEPIFELLDLELPSTATHAETFPVNVTVENRGASDGSIPLELRIDGAAVAGRTVSVESGETRTFSFEGVNIDAAGEYQVSVHAPNASVEGQITIEEASGTVSVDTQGLGTGPDGDPAILATDVAAEAGWFLVATAGSDAGDVIGFTELSTARDGAAEPVAIADTVGIPGPVTVSLVAQGAALTVGDPIPSSAEVIASDPTTILDVGINMANQTYINEAERVTVEAANVLDGDAGSTPYVVVIHRQVGDSLAETVGTSPVLWGTTTDLEIELDEPLSGGETREYAAALYFVDGGSPGAPITRLDGTDERVVSDAATVEVRSQAVLTIADVDLPDESTAGDPLQISVTVSNDGTTDGSQTVWISIGSHVSLQTVEVPAGETAEVSATWRTDLSDAGVHDVRVETLDDRYTGSVSIDAPPPTPTPTPSDDSPGLGVAIALLALGLAAGVARWRRG